MAMNWSATNAPLPPGWEARWDATYNRYYFIDHATQKTSWTDPRLNNAAHNRPPVESIPLQDFRSQPSTSTQSTSKDTGFNYGLQALLDEDDDDKEWRDALLRSTLENDSKKKHLLFHEKVNMKEKFKREFKVLDAVLVENTVEQHDYDEEMIKATLASLKDAHFEKERKKRAEADKKRKIKEEEEKKKVQQRKKELDRIKKELKEIKEAEQKAKLEAERLQRAAASKKTTSTAFHIDINKRPGSAQNAAKKNTPQQAQPRQMIPKDRRNKAPAKKQPTPKPAGHKAVYVSPNRLQPAGPQASLRKGPDRSHLVRYQSNACGPNKALVSGPQRVNWRGPGGIEAKGSLSKGPQALLRQGPQCRLSHAQERSRLIELPPSVSAV